jgi:hypothetical protein
LEVAYEQQPRPLEPPEGDQHRHEAHLRVVEPERSDAHEQVCPACKGAGFLVADVPYGHPRFAELIPCACRQADQQQRRQTQLEQVSNIAHFRDQTFATFDPTCSTWTPRSL